MALFLVNRQIYQEASEVFYSHAFLHFYGDDFSKVLVVLHQFPLDSMQRLRRLKFTMIVAQCGRARQRISGTQLQGHFKISLGWIPAP